MKRRFPRVQKPQVDPIHYQQILDDSSAAKEFLESTKWAFLRDYLTARQNQILQTFARQSIDSYSVESNGLTVHHDASKQYSHLAGEFKGVEKLFSWVKNLSEQGELMKKNTEIKEPDVL